MNEIKKYVKEQLESSTEDALKKDLVSRGYAPDDVDNIISDVKNGKKRGRLMYYSILAGVILIALLVRFLLLMPGDAGQAVSKGNEYDFGPKNFSDDPKDWFSENNASLNVEAATNGSGFVSGNSLQYLNSDVQTSFVFDGFYQGKHFERNFFNNGELMVEVTNELNPSDGIPQIFISQRIINDSAEVYIFVDDDWKEKIVPNYVWWGRDFEKTKIFSYSNEIKSGIYLDIVDDTRFAENFNIHMGGLLVGDLTQQKIDDGNRNVTYVRVR